MHLLLQRIQQNIEHTNASLDVNEMLLDFTAGLSEAVDETTIVAVEGSADAPPSEVYMCGSNT